MPHMALWCVVVALLLGPAVADLNCKRPSPEQRIHVFGRLNYTRRIRTSSPEAQALFSQSMALLAGYNQAEAVASLRAALTFDPHCAMCYWGLAYARMPFQNKPAIATLSGAAAAFPVPRYSEQDLAEAARAASVAAALAGLAAPSEWNATATAAAASLTLEGAEPLVAGGGAATPGPAAVGAVKGRRRSDRRRLMRGGPGDVDPGAGPGLAGTGDGADLRLMERLASCPPSWTLAKGLEAKEKGPAGGRRRALGVGDGGGGKGEGKGGRRGLLAQERHYIAAMFDRLAVRATHGGAWELAEKRFAQDMIDIGSCWAADADAPALAAEALANLSPWDFADPDTGAPRPLTPLILELIREALSRDPRHPLATHLHIHVTEGFPAGRGDGHAGLAESSADALHGLLPGLDHLQHMPSHTYMRVGRWSDAVQSNVAALRASALGSSRCVSSLYPDHNAAMLLHAASMAGELRTADVYARVLRELPRWVRDAPASLGYQWGAPLPVWVRFARWQPVMFMPPPPRDDANTTSPAAAAGSGLGDGGPVRPGSALSNRTKAYNDTLIPLLTWDVATDTHVLDPALRYPSARNASTSSSSTTSPPGPREGLLTDSDFSRDGAAFARVLWHWARAMALAGQVAALKEGSGTGSPPPPPPPTPPGVALSQTDLDAIRVQQEHQAQAGQAAGAESARLQKAYQELADRVVALGRAVRELPEDVALPPGQGLGVVVLGYRLVADVLEQVARARQDALHGRLSEAEALLRGAVEREAAGGYFEPPRVHQPPRQCLGWVQLSAGKVAEAAQTYLADLAHNPDNPWSVRGLNQTLERAPTALAALKAQVMSLEQQQQQQAGGGPGAGAATALQVARERLKGTEAAVAAARAAQDGASARTRAAAERLQSSCPAFSARHM